MSELHLNELPLVLLKTKLAGISGNPAALITLLTQAYTEGWSDEGLSEIRATIQNLIDETQAHIADIDGQITRIELLREDASDHEKLEVESALKDLQTRRSKYAETLAFLQSGLIKNSKPILKP